MTNIPEAPKPEDIVEGGDVKLYIPEDSPHFHLNGPAAQSAAEELDRALSYKIEGAEYSEAVKQGYSDGKEHLFNVGRNRGPAGLITRAATILEAAGFGVETTDERQRFGERGNLHHNWNFEHELWPHQLEAIKEAIKNREGIIQIPTGGGKTAVALGMIRQYRQPAAIIVHTEELFKQWISRVNRILGVQPGRYGNSMNEPGNPTIAMSQTIARNGLGPIEETGVAIFDECHSTSAATTYHKAAKKLPTRYRFGLSATPWRRNEGEELKIEGVVGQKIYEVGVKQLINEKILATPEFRTEPGGVAPEKTTVEAELWERYEKKYPGKTQNEIRRIVDSQIYNEIYRRTVTHNDARNAQSSGVAKKLALKGRQVLVDVDRIEHGRRINQRIRDVKSKFIHANSNARESSIEKFRNGQYPILISTLIKEGVDIPKADALVYASGGRSPIALIQAVGRVLRGTGKSNDAIIVDFHDRGKYVEKHFRQRQNALAKYYGGYYE